MLLSMLILIDLVFVCLHLVYINTDYLSSMYSLAKDRGYSEIFQYIKLSFTIFLFGILARRRRPWVYVSWLLVFSFLLIDDAFLIHETYGLYLSDALPIQAMFRLRGQDFGELLITGVASAVLISIVALAYLRAGSVDRVFVRKLAAWLVALVFFGVFADMLHEMLIDSPLADAIGIIEDGGEMVVTSGIAWFVFRDTLKTTLKG
jgi:hypothetical protein